MKPTCICLGILAVSISACKQNKEIKTYPASPEPAPAAAAPAADPHAGVPGMAGGKPGADPHAGLTAEQMAAAGTSTVAPVQVADSPPAHWKRQPPSPFLLVKYQIQGEADAVAEATFSTLRSVPGSLLANINRWRGQMDQAPIDEATLKQNTQTVKTPFGDGVLVDIEGLAPGGDAKRDGRLVGVIAEQGGSAWYFKLRGNAALAAAEKANFTAWITSIKAAPADPAAPPTAAPATGAPAAPAPVAPTGDGSLTWQLPNGWTAAPVVSGMVYANFTIPGTEAKVAISHLMGDAGGDLANVNRWRGQVGLPPVDEAGLAPIVTKITAGPKTFSLIDATGAQAGLLVGWLRHGSDTWFFKLTGPGAAIAQEKAKFTAFLESVRFTKPE